MIITLSTPSKHRIIHNCPGEYKSITIYDHMRWSFKQQLYIQITKVLEDDSEIYNEITHNDIIKQFVENYNTLTVTKEIWEFFYDIIGYVPFYKYRNDKYIHKPHRLCSLVDEILSWRKPIKFVNILGYNIPKGLVKHMKLLNNIRESTEDSGLDYSEYLKFPEHIQPYVSDALEKLTRLELHDFSLYDMAVYDFLEMLEVINTNPVFYNGSKLIKKTPLNVFNAGYLEKPMCIYYEFWDVCDVAHDHPLITDTIIEHSERYKDFADKYGDMSGFECRMMKLLLTRKGYL